MLKTLLGLFALIFFYFGTYKLIKDYIKINPFFIPVFINLGIMLLLYVAGLIGLLRPAVWIIGFTGILYFIIYLIKNRNLLHSDVKSAIILGLGTFRTFFNKNSIVQALMVLIGSAATSFAFMNMTINIWAHDKPLMLLLFVFVTFMIFPVTYIHADHSLKLINKDRLFRNLSIWIFILSIVFFVFLLSGNEFLVPNTDSITIQNIGTESTNADRSEIILIEVKDKSTGVKLKYESNDNWADVSSADNTSGIISSYRDDSLLFKFSDKGPTIYEFLFLETPTSGVVEININRDTYIYDLYNESVDQKTIDISSSYHPLDILVLCANFLFSITLLQIGFKYVFLFKAGQEGPFLSKYNKYFFYLFLTIGLFLFTRPMLFSVWDEFSHWGIFIKELSIRNMLPIENFCTVVPRYIPGISLFEYFFTTFLGYAEGHAYFAYLFFVFSAIWTVLIDTSPQKILLRITYILSIIIALFFLPLYFISLYVDVALGLLFGVGLIYYLKYCETSFGGAGIFLIFCGLQLMKTWGLVFSIILFGIIIFDKIFSQKQGNHKGKYNLKKEVFFITLILLCSILLIQIPWQIHMQKNGITSPLDGGSVLLDLFQNGTRLDTKALFKSLIDITTKGRQDTNLHGALSIINLSLLLLSISILISFKAKQIIRFNLSIFLFFIMNILLIFLTYFVNFSEEEAVKLASYERYVSEFFAGWFLLLIYLISSGFRLGYCSHKSSKIAHVSLIAMIVLFLPAMNKIIHIPPHNYIGRREILKYILEKHEDTIFDGKYHRIFHIAQNTNGLTHYSLRYELCPNTAQFDEWSFGEPYPSSESECDTIPYSIDELYKIITSDYDYVLITEPDKQLWQYYGEIFQGYRVDGDQLFKVDKEQIIIFD